jgi:sugar-specific transcriptional regulator TrmB
MGRKTRYQVVELGRVLDRLIKRYENDLDKKKRLVEEFIKMVCRIYNRGTQSVDVSKNVEIIADLPMIHERYMNLVKNTKHELVGFVKRTYAHKHKRQEVGEQEKEELEILRRGTTVRMIYEFPREDELEFLIPRIEKYMRLKEKVRLIEYLPTRMYVFDQRYVLMALGTPGRATSMLMIEHSDFARAARNLFDHYWKKACDYDNLLFFVLKEKKTRK